MANLFLALILISIVILLAGASADLRITYTDSLNIRIDFLFFSLLFYNGKRKKQGRKRDLFERLKISIKKTRASLSALEFILKNSRVTVHSLNIPVKDGEPSELVTRRANISSLILVIFTYLSLKAEKMTVEEDNVFSISDLPKAEEPTLDFALKTTVYIILSALIIYLLKINSKAERSKKKNVRNENE